MQKNVLTEIPLIQTDTQRISVRDFLLGAHTSELKLDKSVSGFEFGAQWRLLTSIVAVILQKDINFQKKTKIRVKELLHTGLPADLVDKGLSQLEPATNLFDKEFPFFQRPVLPPRNAKDRTRVVSADNKPVWKISPTSPSEPSQAYWDLSKHKPDTLELSDAIRALLIFSMYSFAGNAKYDGAKCLNGSPGIRFLGAGNTATEIIVDSTTPLESIFKSIPISWTIPDGLPAWADRTAKKSRLKDGSLHPLWRATWHSNTVACAWDDTQLVGVCPGGIPDNWFMPTEMGTSNDSRKEWWDRRNQEDPFYFYQADSTGTLKAQRIDLSKDLTELAVQWAHDGLTENLDSALRGRILSPDFIDDSILFLRHQIGGNASSPMIRESVITSASKSTWRFDGSEELLLAIRNEAGFILKLRNIICSPFRRSSNQDSENGYPVLDDLADLRPAVNDAYWRSIEPIYQQLIAAHDPEEDSPDSAINLRRTAANVAGEAFTTVLRPYLLQNPQRNYRVQQRIRNQIHNLLKTYGELSDD